MDDALQQLAAIVIAGGAALLFALMPGPVSTRAERRRDRRRLARVTRLSLRQDATNRLRRGVHRTRGAERSDRELGRCARRIRGSDRADVESRSSRAHRRAAQRGSDRRTITGHRAGGGAATGCDWSLRALRAGRDRRARGRLVQDRQGASATLDGQGSRRGARGWRASRIPLTRISGRRSGCSCGSRTAACTRSQPAHQEGGVSSFAPPPPSRAPRPLLPRHARRSQQQLGGVAVTTQRTITTRSTGSACVAADGSPAACTREAQRRR